MEPNAPLPYPSCEGPIGVVFMVRASLIIALPSHSLDVPLWPPRVSLHLMLFIEDTANVFTVGLHRSVRLHGFLSMACIPPASFLNYGQVYG